MPSLLIDANISYRIKQKLIEVYDNVLHVSDIKTVQPISDLKIWEYAKTNDFLVVTFDTDFEKLLNQKGFPPKLILFKTGNQSTKFISDTLVSIIVRINQFEKNPINGLLEII